MAKGTPQAVKDAAKKADKLHKEIYGEPDTDTKEIEAEAPGNEDAGSGGDIQPVETQAQKDSTGDTSTPSKEEGGEVTEIKPPSDPEPKPEEVKAKEPKPEADWEQKYKALQGKYNAEVPRMAGELRELKHQMEQLVAAKQEAPPAEPSKDTQKNIVSEQDIVDYGEDLVDFIRRVARAEAENTASTLTPTIEEIKGQVVQSKQQQAKNSIYSKLDADVQDWREINKSQDFLEWLATRDPYVGDYRKNLLSSAFADGDAERVAAFFKGFKAERQAVTPAREETPPPAADPAPTKKEQVSLEQLAGPSSGPSSNAVNTQPDQAPIWTRAQIAAFYQDVNSGVYVKNPERKAQIENSIAVAMQEGRIQ